MQSIDSFINTLGFPTAFEIIFGLIISMILFLIDRSEKKRQEETLRRQDESLDIILEQVSKVNVFQTKTLSLAIESLGKDFENFRKDIENIKEYISSEYKTKSVVGDDLHPAIVMESDKEPRKSTITSLSANFGNLLSNQINSFIEQMKSNLSGLTNLKSDEKKNIYKVKKGLEFDIKDLFNIQNMVNELKEDNNSEITNSSRTVSNTDEELDRQDSTDKFFTKQSEIRDKKFMKKDKPMDFVDINEKLDKLETIPELVKFTESIIKNFENTEFFQKNHEKFGTGKKEKKKVTPTKFVSKNDLEKQEK